MKSDENGNRPVGHWALITNKGDEFVQYCRSMHEAIENYELFKNSPDANHYTFFHVGYVVANEGQDGCSCYEDKNGQLYTDYDAIKL